MSLAITLAKDTTLFSVSSSKS